jgi:hypothetical protein
MVLRRARARAPFFVVSHYEYNLIDRLSKHGFWPGVKYLIEAWLPIVTNWNVHSMLVNKGYQNWVRTKSESKINFLCIFVPHIN